MTLRKPNVQWTIEARPKKLANEASASWPPCVQCPFGRTKSPPRLGVQVHVDLDDVLVSDAESQLPILLRHGAPFLAAVNLRVRQPPLGPGVVLEAIIKVLW